MQAQAMRVYQIAFRRTRCKRRFTHVYPRTGHDRKGGGESVC